ncbi:hypothetical protein [Streptomyces sp. cg2]|uniref:hypothetical protein n=1 Tax=Streptomyces sp. cg2 TaxID=3238799 RepID=UPI0034E28D2C
MPDIDTRIAVPGSSWLTMIGWYGRGALLAIRAGVFEPGRLVVHVVSTVSI